MGICFVGDQPYPPLLGPARGKRWKSSHKVKHILWYDMIYSQRPSGINNFQYQVDQKRWSTQDYNEYQKENNNNNHINCQSDKEWVKDGGRHKEWPISDGGWLHSRQHQVVDNYRDYGDFRNNGHWTFDHNNFNRAGEFGQEGPSDLDISSVVFLVDQPKVLQLLTLTLILHSLTLLKGGGGDMFWGSFLFHWKFGAFQRWPYLSWGGQLCCFDRAPREKWSNYGYSERNQVVGSIFISCLFGLFITYKLTKAFRPIQKVDMIWYVLRPDIKAWFHTSPFILKIIIEILVLSLRSSN